jgi:cell division protein FtsW (lipid II flippase)
MVLVLVLGEVGGVQDDISMAVVVVVAVVVIAGMTQADFAIAEAMVVVGVSKRMVMAVERSCETGSDRCIMFFFGEIEKVESSSWALNRSIHGLVTFRRYSTY